MRQLKNHVIIFFIIIKIHTVRIVIPQIIFDRSRIIIFVETINSIGIKKISLKLIITKKKLFSK